MSAPVRWLVGLVLAVVAIGITWVTPPERAVTAPFVVTGQIGETVQAREGTLLIDQVALADQVTDADGEDALHGTWLVLRIAVTSVREPESNWLAMTQLLVDGRTYSISRHVKAQFITGILQPGLPLQGWLAFELPAGTTSGEAELVFTQSIPNPQLDSEIRVRLQLEDLDHRETVALTDAERIPS